MTRDRQPAKTNSELPATLLSCTTRKLGEPNTVKQHAPEIRRNASIDELLWQHWNINGRNWHTRNTQHCVWGCTENVDKKEIPTECRCIQDLHKVDAKSHPSPLFPLCNTHTYDTHHLFNCTHIRTTLSPLDLWTDPAGVLELLARWRDMLAGGPKVG